MAVDIGQPAPRGPNGPISHIPMRNGIAYECAYCLAANPACKPGVGQGLAPLADDSEKARREITEAFSQCVSVLETHSTELKRTRTAEDDENDARNARRGSMRSFKARYHYPLKIS